jgi:hypothetical protein
VRGPLKAPLSALQLGAGLLVGTLKLGSAVLGGIAGVVEGVFASADDALRDTPADAAIPTPVGVVGSRAGALVAPEGFIAVGEHERVAGVEDVLSDPEPRGARAPSAPASSAPPAPAPPDRPAVVPEPAHVDEEAVLVGEFADPGAENGAGPQIRVEEPWEGYRLLRAPEVIDRLVAQPDEALLLVLLYERAHRARRTVLAEAERELARRTANG